MKTMIYKYLNRIVRRALFVLLLFCLVSSIIASGKDKFTHEQLNERFRNIADEMKEAYDKGNLNKVINLFNKNCLKNKKELFIFRKVEEDIRMDIYRIAALSYDDLDETVMRDKYIKKILDIRPYMESGIYRQSWRKIAQEKYIVLPRILFGVNVGPNIAIAHPYKRYSILGPVQSTVEDIYHKDYSYRLLDLWGAQLSGVIEYTLSKHFSVYMEVASISLAFRYKTGLKQEIGGEQVALDFIYRQRLYYIEMPFYLKYRFTASRSILKPYIQIGGFFRILQFAHKSIDRTVRIGPGPPEEDTSAFYLRRLVSRFGNGFCIGGGFTYETRFSGFHLFLEFGINYKHGFNNIVNSDLRYSDNELISEYYDVFDDIKLRSLDFSFKILLPITFKAFTR